jgi:hypothetical protein
MTSDLDRHVGKYYGKYSGSVVSNADATKTGILSVIVPSVFGPTMQVDARPCFAFGQFFVPADGTKVWVEFEGGDTQYPIWTGIYYPAADVPTEAQKDPPDNRVIRTPSGHTVELNDETDNEAVVIRHKDNSFVAIDKDGSVVISNKNGSNIYLNADRSEVSITSEQGHTIAMNDDAMVLMNKDGAALDLTGNTVRITAGSIILEGTTVALGVGAAQAGQPLILANAFKTLWDIFQNHTHATAMGPTATPLPPTPLVPAAHFTGAAVAK